MQTFLNFFGLRRFNYVDVIALVLFTELWSAGHMIIAIATIVPLALVSVTIERRIE